MRPTDIRKVLKFVYSAIQKLNNFYRSSRSTVGRHFGNRTSTRQERQLGNEFEESVPKEKCQNERQQQNCQRREKAIVP